MLATQLLWLWSQICTCSTFSSKRTSTWAEKRGRRSISASGCSFPYLVTREWYLQSKRAGCVFTTVQPHTCTHSYCSVPIRQLLLGVVYVVTDEEPLCVFSLTIGHHAAVEQWHRRKPEREDIQTVAETARNQKPRVAGARLSDAKRPVQSRAPSEWRGDSPCYHQAASLCVGVGLQQGNALQSHLLQLGEEVQLFNVFPLIKTWQSKQRSHHLNISRWQ